MPFPDSLRLAVGTLTVFPVAAPRQLDRRTARNAIILAPIAVLPLAVLSGGVGWFAHRIGWPPPLCGIVVLVALVLGTRALHLDGLADTIDGLGSGADADQALEIMRRGDVGPMGATALILVLGGQAVAIGQLAVGWQGSLQLAVLICCSRAALSLGCLAGVPAARPDGLGAAVAGTVPRWLALLTWLVIAGILVLVSAWRATAWWLGLLAAAAVLLAVGQLVRRCRGRLGGVTGDVLGATVEIAFAILVLVAIL